MKNPKPLFIYLFFSIVISFGFKPNLQEDRLKENIKSIIRKINQNRRILSESFETKFNTHIDYLMLNTSGIVTLNEQIFYLKYLNNHIKNKKDIEVILPIILENLELLNIQKKTDLYNSNWQVSLDYIDKNLFTESTNLRVDLFSLLKNLKEKFSGSSSKTNIIKIIEAFKSLDTNIGKEKKLPNKLKKLLFNIKINFIASILLERGILAPNKTWWHINDLILKDKSGVKFYYKIKKNYEMPLIPISALGERVYLINDNNFIKQVLKQSPYVFGVGKLKKMIFKSFMKDNVGISEGKEWHKRRIFNTRVLCFEQRHLYCKKFNNYIKNYLSKGLPKNYEEFLNTGRKITTNIVFNEKNEAPKELYLIFSKANNMKSLIQKNFKIDDKTRKIYFNYLKKNIDNPQKGSLLELAVKYINECPSCTITKDELLYQIPHWMFPTLSCLTSVVPRLLLILYNHPKVLEKVVKEIKSIDISDGTQIYKLQYLYKCILEILRLNNLVVTLFRTLKRPYNFGYDGIGRKYEFKKGTQFLILTNPVLRDPENFQNPNQFVPERWDKALEKSYYSIMFSQGPQSCPGKHIAMFVTQSFIAHYLKYNNYRLKSQKININYIEQMINPFKIKFDI